MRKLVPWLFIGLFFLISPLLIIFATGYRYDAKEKQWSKTGALILDSKPDAAFIRLNGELQNVTTPATLTNLPPGRYALRVFLPEHTVWQKTIHLPPSTVRSFNMIRLFAESAPLVTAARDVVAFAQNQNGLFLLSEKKDGWRLEARASAESIPRVDLPVRPGSFKNPSRLLPHPTDQSVFLVFEQTQTGENAWVLQRTETAFVPMRITTSFSHLQWHPREILLIGLNAKRRLVSFDPFQQKISPSLLLDEPLEHFVFDESVPGTFVYYSTDIRKGQRAALKGAPLSGKDKTQNIFVFPPESYPATISLGPKEMVTAHDPAHGFSLITIAGDLLLQAPGDHIRWDGKKQRAVVWDEHTLSLVQREGEIFATTLLEQWDEKIVDVRWLTDETPTHLAIALERTLRILTLDTPHQDTVLFTTDSSIQKIADLTNEGIALRADKTLLWRSWY